MSRKLNFRVLAALVCIAIPYLGWAQSKAPSPLTVASLRAGLGKLQDIALTSGVNDVYFKGPEQSARIVTALIQNADGSSRLVFFISMQDEESNWIVVPTGDQEDAIVENELDPDGYFRDVRFMNGTLGGQDTTFLFVSTLDGPRYKSRAPSATISVETLQSPLGDCCAPFEFVPILQFKTKAGYTDAAVALKHELNIPLPAGYQPG
ncbi:MAG: hypothetical protein KGH75_12960 [Rhodospirillales bacterium]|nr:hypothetical protein [Rhodospirillales bacterium]